MLWVWDRLETWSDWARGNQLLKQRSHPLATMMRVAAGEVRGRDLDIPYELTFQIEATDKAVAMLRQQNRQQKRIIMRYWMGRIPVYRLAHDLRVSEERMKAMLDRAILQVGRNIITVEERLTETDPTGKIGGV